MAPYRPLDFTCLRFRPGVVLLVALQVGLLGTGVRLASADASDPTAQDVESTGFERQGFFRAVRPDLRLCPSPFCGGYFVEWVNRRATRCADGKLRKECHAVLVDLSALGLDPAAEAELLGDFAAKRTLIRGALERVDLGIGMPVQTLVASEAWRGVTGSQGDSGRFWGVVSSGIVCITYPCPSSLRMKLNRPRVGWLHSVDLDQTGATPEEVEAGFAAIDDGPGLIGFGGLRKITGPAGMGFEFAPSEFYQRVDRAPPDGSTTCGYATCGPGLVCCNPVMGICTLPGEVCIQ